jgi:hypothetical protein
MYHNALNLTSRLANLARLHSLRPPFRSIARAAGAPFRRRMIRRNAARRPGAVVTYRTSDKGGALVPIDSAQK